MDAAVAAEHQQETDHLHSPERPEQAALTAEAAALERMAL
jgi:hypothetical protein